MGRCFEVTKAHGKSGVSGNVVSTVLDGVLFDKNAGLFLLPLQRLWLLRRLWQLMPALKMDLLNGLLPLAQVVVMSAEMAALKLQANFIAAGWDAKADGENSIAVVTVHQQRLTRQLTTE